MPHQCVHCGRIIPAGSKELLEGCSNCKSHFFFYIRDEQLHQVKEKLVDIPKKDKKQVEKDIRDIAGIVEEDVPVILDIESVRVTGPGKFEIDIVNLFRKDRPLIYKLEEGKYIIDLASTLSKSMKDVPEIQDPDKFKDKEGVLVGIKEEVSDEEEIEKVEKKVDESIKEEVNEEVEKAEIEEKVEDKLEQEIKEQVKKDIKEEKSDSERLE